MTLTVAFLLREPLAIPFLKRPSTKANIGENVLIKEEEDKQ